MSKLIIKIITILLGKKTNDPLSGFFIIKKNIFFTVEKKLYNRGFKILADIIFSIDKNITVYDYNIKFGKRLHNNSKMNFFVLLDLIILIFFKFLNKLKLS